MKYQFLVLNFFLLSGSLKTNGNDARIFNITSQQELANKLYPEGNVFCSQTLGDNFQFGITCFHQGGSCQGKFCKKECPSLLQQTGFEGNPAVCYITTAALLSVLKPSEENENLQHKVCRAIRKEQKQKQWKKSKEIQKILNQCFGINEYKLNNRMYNKYKNNNRFKKNQR